MSNRHLALNYRTSGSSVVISGASTGIGACCAITLAKLGWQVFAGVRNLEDAKPLQQAHTNIQAVLLDVTNEASILACREQVEQALNGKPLHGLVNNAGIAVGGPLEFVPIDNLRRQLEVNVIGQIAVSQAFIPLLRQGAGRIVNMGSIAGLNALPFIGPYSASKFALESLTDALRVELQPWGIEVSIIEPGAIATPIWEKSLQAAEEAARQLPTEIIQLYGPALECIRKATLRSAQRGIPPEQVAEAVVHALTAHQPRTRYLVGKDAQLRHILCWIPDRLKDWLITRKVGLPAKYSR